MKIKSQNDKYHVKVKKKYETLGCDRIKMSKQNKQKTPTKITIKNKATTTKPRRQYPSKDRLRLGDRGAS